MSEAAGTQQQPNPPTRVLTPQELDALLQQARSDEKSKLYADINFQKSKVDQLETQLADLKKKQEDVTNTARQNDDLQKKIDGLENSLKSVNTEFESKLTAAVEKTLTTASEAFERQRQADRVELKRDALIDAADGKIIPEMVSGKTVEEIEASVAKAKETWIRIYEAGKTEAAKGALPGPITPGNGTTAAQPGNEQTSQDYRKLSGEEWEQQKNTIKDKVFADLGLRRKQ